MRNYKLSLKSAQTMLIEGLQADYFRVLTADNPVEVQINQSSPLSGMEKGMAYKSAQAFNKVSITSETDQEVEVMIGFGNIDDNRSTINGTVGVEGTVKVVNADKSRTEAEKAFMGGSGTSGVASKYGYIYLANPSGSGVNLVVNQLIFSNPSSSKNLKIKLSEDYSLLESETGFTSSGSSQGNNKMIGGAVSKGLVKVANSTQSSHTNEKTIMTTNSKVDEMYIIKFTEPYVVPEGMAIIINDSQTAEIIKASFEWFEESNA